MRNEGIRIQTDDLYRYPNIYWESEGEKHFKLTPEPKLDFFHQLLGAFGSEISRC
jgi:hypothetical protein